MSKVTLISSGKNWIEHTAIEQLHQLEKLEDVIQVVGLPDLHAGKTPVGVAVISKNRIYPHIIGNDIGCGMGLFSTGIKKKKFKLDRLEMKLNNIRALKDIEAINPYKEPCPIYDLGTIGGGNHFVEFVQVKEILDEEDYNHLNINKNEFLTLVHSGSRSYGDSIFTEFSNTNGYTIDSEDAQAYLAKYTDALLWAERNRYIVVDKLLNYIGFKSNIETVIDCKHNFIEQRGECFIHRKGSVSGEVGAVVIPGSRGSLTYIVKPTQQVEQSAYSLSHGAGRKWARSLCKSRIKSKYNKDTIRQTKLKSRVICHDTELLYQEAPEAYKNIEEVIKTLETYGLINVIATLKPILTYKG